MECAEKKAKKKKAKKTSEKQTIVPVQKGEKQPEKPVQPEKQDDGFTVVTKGAVIRDAIAIQKITSPSLFEESEEEGGMEEAMSVAALVDEDVLEWNE